MNRIARDALFDAIEEYAKRNSLGYTAAGDRLGIPRWQMTRWFSPKAKSYTGWTFPKPRILERLVLADEHPISTIALGILRADGMVQPNFDYKRAAATFGLSGGTGLPVALFSAVMADAPPELLQRAAVFDLVSAFVNTRYLTELGAAAADGCRLMPIHPFGMTAPHDPESSDWPPVIGRIVLETNYSDEAMLRLGALADDVLSAANTESVRLHRMMERVVRLPMQSMSLDNDIELALMASTDARRLADSAHKMSLVFTTEVPEDSLIAKLPLFRIASRMVELSELTLEHACTTESQAVKRATATLGAEAVATLTRPSPREVVPMVKVVSGRFLATAKRTCHVASPVPRQHMGTVAGEQNAFFFSTSDPLEQAASKNEEHDDSDFLAGWRNDQGPPSA